MFKAALLLLSAAALHGAVLAHVESGPLNLNGQSNQTFENLHITSTSGPCVTLTNSTNITIHNSEIGPCATQDTNCQGDGQGVNVTGGSGNRIIDNYIHPECGKQNTRLRATYDGGNDILCEGSSGLLVHGNILAWGAGAAFFSMHCPSAIVRGNFILNPINANKGNRGSATQMLDGSGGSTVDRNYIKVTTDPAFGFPGDGTDLINFGSINGNPPNNFGATITGNYITGGVWQYGCSINMEGGMSYPTSSPLSTIANNVVVNGATCGISIESGFNYKIDNNKVFSSPVNGFANSNPFQILQCYGGPGSACGDQVLPCGNITVTNNLGYGIGSTGIVNGMWRATDFPCSNVTMGAGNAFDTAPNQTAYNTMLPLMKTTMAAPAIPPVPYSCVVASPFTNNTSARCDGLVVVPPPPPPPPPAITCLGLKSPWSFLNPAGGTCWMDGVHVVLTAPAGRNHDPQYGGMDNAVRIMQPISAAEFGVQVKFDSIPSKSYQFQGVIVEQDAANYLRMQFGYNGAALVVNADTITGATTSNTMYVKPVSGMRSSLWMRVTKFGSTITQSWSPDGVNWQVAGSFDTPLVFTAIGPYAANFSGDPTVAPEFVGKIDYFSRITVPVKGLPVTDTFNQALPSTVRPSTTARPALAPAATVRR